MIGGLKEARVEVANDGFDALAYGQETVKYPLASERAVAAKKYLEGELVVEVRFRWELSAIRDFRYGAAIYYAAGLRQWTSLPRTHRSGFQDAAARRARRNWKNSAPSRNRRFAICELRSISPTMAAIFGARK